MRFLSFRNSMRLFLIITFPIQLWSIFISLRNVESVIERTFNLMDGIGYVSYALLTALVESLLLFILILLFGFLLPRHFDEEKRVVQLALLGYAIIFWMMIEQIYTLFEISNPGITLDFIFQFSHPYRVTILTFGFLLLLIIMTIALPMFFLNRNKRTEMFLGNIFSRIIPLSIFYIVLDVAGIIVVVFRNI